jgi:uncharacterized protein (DUF952 family)
MTPREKRVLFTSLKCQLLSWIGSIGTHWPFDGKVQVAEAEGFVYRERHVKIGMEHVVATDAVHIPTSRHYDGLAVDLLIYIDGEYVSSGDHPIWNVIDAQARKLHPDFHTGLAWGDANHLTFEEGK